MSKKLQFLFGDDIFKFEAGTNDTTTLQ